jgi:tetratricopeptide (TPR) repeat protein
MRKKKSIKYHLLIVALVVLLTAACNQKNTTSIDSRKVKSQETISAENETDLGNHQWIMGNYQEALRYFSEAYKKVKKSGDKKTTATLLNNLGLVHWRLNDNEAAMECYNEAAQLAEEIGMKRLLGLTHTNRALILKEQRLFELAFEHNNKAIELFLEINEPRDLAIAYNNQGQIYRFSEQLDPALKYYHLSLNECKKIDYKEGMATAWQNISTIYNQKGDAYKAFEAARKCLNLSKQLNSKVRISESYLELSRNHERFEQPDSALYYYKKHYEVEKEIMNTNQSERLSEYQAKLGMEVKNLRIKNLQNEKEIATNRLWLTTFGTLAILLIITFIVYRYLSKIRFKKQQLELELHNSQQIIDIKEQELKTYIIDLSRKNAIINSLQEETVPELEQAEASEDEIAELLEQKILTDEDWAQFQVRFKAIYPGFFVRIKESQIPLTEAETRILVLMRLELNGKDMANILGISPQSVRVCKMRLKKKLPADKYETVEDFLQFLIK